MKIAILKTGAPPPELEARFGGYPEMIMTMIGPEHDYEVFDVREGPMPEAGAHHGVIVTGSPSGVYDGEAWIFRLMGWLNVARGRCRMVGLCFGHQAMATAFGGEVRKSDKGWGIGLHRHGVERRYSWMTPPAEALRLPVSHQDQVMDIGQTGDVFLSSDFCRFAGLWYGDDAISFQGHPEFTPEFAKALIEARRGTRYADPFAGEAIASLDGPNDREIAAAWIRTFLAGAVEGTNRIG